MLEHYFAESVPGIDPTHIIYDALAAGQSIQGGTDERVILFVKLGEGIELSDELQKTIRVQIRTKRSARHVPEVVSIPQS